MRLEIVLPDEDPTMAPERIVALAVQAEQAGVHTVWLPDHVLPPGEYGATFGGVFEPLVTLTYLAARTTRIRLGTSVLVLPLRNPFVVAKQVATLDRLSGGRVVLGVGTGWNEDEFAAVGADFAARGSRTDEAIDLLRTLWRDERRFDGPTYGFEGGVFEPRPTRTIPIMVGGVSPRALRRVAERADEWQGLALTPDEFAEHARTLRSRTDRPVRLGTRIGWDSDLDELLVQVEGFAAAGAEHLAIWLGADHEQAEDRLRRLVAAPSVRAHLT